MENLIFLLMPLRVFGRLRGFFWSSDFPVEFLIDLQLTSWDCGLFPTYSALFWSTFSFLFNFYPLQGTITQDRN